MLTYLFLMRSEEDLFSSLSPEQMQEHLNKWHQWMSSLAADGALLAGHPLEGNSACVSQAQTLDGPYTESKDVIGGFVLVKCVSFEHALSLAQQCPHVELGGLLEVRQTASNVLERQERG